MTTPDPTTDPDRDGEAIVVKIQPREAVRPIDDPGLPRDGAELHPPGLHHRPPFRLSVLPPLPEAAIAC